MSICQAIQNKNGLQCTCKAKQKTDENLWVCNIHTKYKIAHVEQIKQYLQNKQIKIDNEIINQKSIEENPGKIPLRNNQNAITHFAIVDPEDFEKVNKYTWCLKKYDNRNCIYANSSKLNQTMHIFLMGNAPGDFIISHIDGNGLNNSRKNLEFASESKNGQNKPKLLGCYSDYKGVSFNIKYNIWAAQSTEINLGTFEHEIDAVKIYDIFVLLKFGPNAKHNNTVVYDEIKNIDITTLIKKDEYGQYITSYKDKQFKVQKIYKGVKLRYIFDTLDEAFDKVYEIKYNIRYNKVSKLDITRNENGDAIIKIKDEYAIVDDNRWYDLMCYSWNKASDKGYFQARVKNKKPYMHQYIYGPVKTKTYVIDHINANNDTNRNNKLSNLREVSQSNNAINCNKSSTAKSIYHGVCPDNTRFLVNIKKFKYTQRFETEIEAAIAFNYVADKFEYKTSKRNDIPKDIYDKYIDNIKIKIDKLLKNKTNVKLDF